jgi:hypothetical protein
MTVNSEQKIPWQAEVEREYARWIPSSADEALLTSEHSRLYRIQSVSRIKTVFFIYSNVSQTLLTYDNFFFIVEN